MTTLYGTSQSRAPRSLWALEELGVKYDHVPTGVPETRTPEHLKRNPNGHIPVLEDGGQHFWESMAINLYLAEKYGKAPFWPASVVDRGHAYQWSFWAMTELEPHFCDDPGAQDVPARRAAQRKSALGRRGCARRADGRA